MRQLGIYRVHLNKIQKPVYFLVMENIHKGLESRGEGLKFDLKGSNNRGKSDALNDLRDREIREMRLQGRLRFELEDADKFLETLAEDVAMLREARLMDYSLMVWALKPKHKVEDELRDWMEVFKQKVSTRLARVAECLQSPDVHEDDQMRPRKIAEVQHLISEVEASLSDVDQVMRNERPSSPSFDIRQSTDTTRSTEDVRQSGQRHLRGTILDLERMVHCGGNPPCALSVLDKEEQHRPCLYCIARKAIKVDIGDLEDELLCQVQRLNRLSSTLKDWFGISTLPQRSRTALLKNTRIGTCYFTTEEGHEEAFEVVAGIADVATRWGISPALNEVGKVLSRHKSCANTSWIHANDWGVSAKPPGIYAERFKECMALYFTSDCNAQEPEWEEARTRKAVRYFFQRAVPDNYYFNRTNVPSPDVLCSE